MPIGGEKIVHLTKHVAWLVVNPSKLRDGVIVLRNILRRARWHDQGGYVGRYKGAWSFASSGLPQASPEEWDALFALAGIEPDEIEARGSCKTCGNAKLLPDGRRVERGYENPCSPCKRPRMSNWVPIEALTEKST